MLIISIEQNSSGQHHFESQSHRTECWRDGYAVVPPELEETVVRCLGYCDITTQERTRTREVVVLREVTRTRETDNGTEKYIEIAPVIEQQEITELIVTNVVEGTPPAPVPESVASQPTAQDDTDAMLVDHEYRMTLLELGVTE